MRHTGVTARGIIAPIFRPGDDLVQQVCQSIVAAAQHEPFAVDDGDIIGITESVVARTQGNYVSCAQITADVRAKFGGGELGLVFPILSRNRFAILLKAIAQAASKLYLQLSYPADEVGNPLIALDLLDEKGVDPYRDSFTEAEFRKVFGADTVHPFTGIDYIEYYRSLSANIEVVFSNDPSYVLKYTKNVLCGDIHSRFRTSRLLRRRGAERVYRMDELMTAPVDGSGFNPEFGLLGSNKATEGTVKLFPRDGQKIVERVQTRMRELTGKTVEVLIYGDGCFKDPVGGIWELADPVVSPAYTARLQGTPNEIKIKYFADNELVGLDGARLAAAMRERIRAKDGSLVGSMASQGTTPRRYSDLVGSLCDLTSGSGDRGTPVIYIKGYFSNFASE